MAPHPLRLGPLVAEGYAIQRSGIRWLVEDGHLCRPGETVAYCNIALVPVKDTPQANRRRPFLTELYDLQVAFAVTDSGRLTRAHWSSLGGFLDWQPDFHFWDADFVIGTLESPTKRQVPPRLRLLFLAGRRTTEFAEAHAGLLTGWHDRARAWWDDGSGPLGTLISVGICEQLGIVRGEQQAFLEMFESVPGPAQIVYIADDALVPCARVLTEQLTRDDKDREAIGVDFAQTFASAGPTPIGRGWIFGGTLLSALQRSPLSEHYDMLSRRGLSRAGPPDAVLLSLHAEVPTIMRHRRLGYHIHCYQYRLDATGPAVRAWLKTSFEPVKRSLDDIAEDYRALIAAIRARSNMKVLVMNSMSSSGAEDVLSYAAFDRPMGDTLSSIHNKEMNLMLHDLAREQGISIVDVDAIAADLGAGANLPDGVHSTAKLQAEIRAEILRLLKGLRVPGFLR